MSSRRIIASCAAMASVLLGTAFSASLTFPLQTVVAASSSAAEQQNPPRDRRPGQAGPETARERELKAAIQANPANSDLYFQLATLQVNRSAPDEADGTIESLKLALPREARHCPGDCRSSTRGAASSSAPFPRWTMPPPPIRRAPTRSRYSPSSTCRKSPKTCRFRLPSGSGTWTPGLRPTSARLPSSGLPGGTRFSQRPAAYESRHGR